MTFFRSTSLVVMLLAAAPAVAQQRPSPAPKPLRGYLIGGGGASTSTPDLAMTFNAEIAENMTRDLQAYLSAGYYDDIMSQEARDQLAQVGAVLTATTGTPWVFSGHDRARSFTGGVKFLIPTGMQIRPYVGGGFGVLNVRRKIHEQSRGNVTNAYLAQFGSPDGVIDPSETNTNHPMAEAALGVGAVVGRAYIDVGYRYRRAFHSTNQSFEVSQVAISAGVKF